MLSSMIKRSDALLAHREDRNPEAVEAVNLLTQ